MHSLQTIKRTNDTEVAQRREQLNAHIVRAALEGLRATGGSSHALNTGKDMRGAAFYAVSIYKDREKQFPRAVRLDELEVYLRNNQDAFDKPRHMLGTWRDSAGVIYVDISIYVDTLADALRIGKENGQRAVYNLATGEEFPIPGTDADRVGEVATTL